MPALVSAVLFGVAALVWLLAGRWLPGGRWVVVHLFTLGVLTTLIAAFTRHFSGSFTGQGAPKRIRYRLAVAVVLDLSVLALLVGRLTHGRVLSVWLVLASALPAEAGTVMRIAATVALLVYGWGVVVVVAVGPVAGGCARGGVSLRRRR